MTNENTPDTPLEDDQRPKSWPTISARVPPAKARALDDLAHAREVPRSTLVNEGIDAILLAYRVRP